MRKLLAFSFALRGKREGVSTWMVNRTLCLYWKRACIILLFLGLGFGCWSWRNNAILNNYSLTNKLIEKNGMARLVRTGDVICRVGNGIWSDLAAGLSIREKRFSHAGFILVNPDASITVIHAEANDFTGIGSVHEEPLVQFLCGGEEAKIFRLRRQLDAGEFERCARRYLGCPFDFKFDLQTTDRLYCTEFVYRVMEDLNPPVRLTTVVSEKGKRYVPVDSCHDPELFEPIVAFKWAGTVPGEICDGN